MEDTNQEPSVEQMLESIQSDAGSGEAAPEGQDTQQQAQQQAVQNSSDVEFEWNGKPIKISSTDPRYKQWLSQGYDYGQRMGEFNKYMTEFQKQQAGIQEMQKRYGPVDEYVKQNPDFWNHVLDAWQQKQQALDPSNPLANEFKNLKEKLQGIEEFKQTLEQERQQAKFEKEDQQLDEQIKSIREQYKDLDFDAVDPQSGKSLEYRILEYASQNGIKSFKTAFRDFYHDDLVKLEAHRAKESVAKNIQQKTKLGISNKGQAMNGGTQGQGPVDTKGMSWGQVEEMALKELGIR